MNEDKSPGFPGDNMTRMIFELDKQLHRQLATPECTAQLNRRNNRAMNQLADMEMVMWSVTKRLVVGASQQAKRENKNAKRREFYRREGR